MAEKAISEFKTKLKISIPDLTEKVEKAQEKVEEVSNAAKAVKDVKNSDETDIVLELMDLERVKLENLILNSDLNSFILR